MYFGTSVIAARGRFHTLGRYEGLACGSHLSPLPARAWSQLGRPVAGPPSRCLPLAWVAPCAQ
eukprot:14690627-Alexandrium_andersonii.AAC.1